MGLALLFFAVAFGGTVGVYFLLTRKLRQDDAERVKGRILGREKPGAAGKKPGKGANPALIQVPEQRKGKLVLQLLDRYNLTAHLEELIEQAGERTSLTIFANQSLGFALAGGVAALIFLPNQQLLAIPAVVVFGLLPYMNLRRKKGGRLRKFEEVFPDTLEFIARSMRAGHAFSVSLEMIHREFPDPVGGEFKRTFEEHNLGMPLDLALQKLAKRIPSLDVHFFVSAVLLQKRTGGNLAEILDKLAFVIRERFKLRGKIRAISAHGKMTATSLSCIPIGVAVLMFFTNPTYVRFFIEDPVGNWMLGAAVGLQLIGYLIMQKIVNIEV